jgi:hypothetical protein
MTELATAGAAEGPPLPPALLIERDLRRQRLSVAFRFLLVIPVAFVLELLALGALCALLVGWFAALILGRLPEPIARYLCHVMRYSTRVNAYSWLLTDRYPPFQLVAPDYPVQVDLAPGRLNRLAVLFRIILAIPAAILTIGATAGLALAGFFIWLWVLVTGRVPDALFDAMTAVLRYNLRYTAYSWLITSAYPGGLLGDPPAPTSTPAFPPGPSAAPAFPPGPYAGPEAPPDPTTGPTAGAEVPPGPGPTAGAAPAPGQGAPEQAPQPALAEPPRTEPSEEAPLAATTAAGPADLPTPSRAPRGWLVLSAAAKRLVIFFLVLGLAAYAAGVIAGVVAGVVNNVPSRATTLANLRTAHDDLVGKGQQAQQKISACGSDASALRCVEAADVELAGAFDTFTSRVEAMKFPASARDESAAVTQVARRFAGALRQLGGAGSVEEYTRLAGGEINQLGSAFDQRYEALVTELEI